MPALLLFADTERSAALRHEVPLAIMDPFLFVDGRTVVLTTLLERDRIASAIPDAELLDMFDLGLRALIAEDGMAREDAIREVAVRAVQRLGIAEAIVPGTFRSGSATGCARRA